MNLSIGKQGIADANAVGVPLFTKQRVQKIKETVSATSKDKREEKGEAPSKSNRKKTEPPAEGGS